MNAINFLLFMFFWLIFGSSVIFAQENTAASGGETTTANGSVSYSIGQIFYNQYSASDGSVIEGVQQPYEISVVTDIEAISSNGIDLVIYPNPAEQYLILAFNNFKPLTYEFELYNIFGSLLKKEIITHSETYIDMSGMAPSAYVLKVIYRKQIIKNFKIIKN